VSEAEACPEGAWNPGLSSTIPRRLRPAVTLFRAEHATLDHDVASELADLSGIPAVELASFTVERLITHELLVRVTADYSVADGPNYADLGISLRGMVKRLSERHVGPELASIRRAHDAERERARAIVERELAERLFGPGIDAPAAAPPGAARAGVSHADGAGGAAALARRVLGVLSGSRARVRPGAPSAGTASASVEPRELFALGAWRERLAASADPSSTSSGPLSGPTADTSSSACSDATGDESLERACLEALLRTVEAIVAHRGALLASRESVAAIALALVGRARGGASIDALVGPIVARGAAAEGFRLLPAQSEPIVMNVKGASASGKSTIRPRQRRLARELGVPWEDFALISPDYWRKYLLDYASLGEDERYGAMLCGEELEIVDRKLDRHMAAKAARGEMSHLLIDRFRFDSFTLAGDRTEESRLLTRFGHEIYLFFMVTPPVETVTRAWIRGRRTGRYKAVDDLLHHNVEAFTGMPALFLSWITAADRRVHVEFLDNDVPEGTLPATAAFGWNERLTILDVTLMRAIDRYREVDVNATRPEDVLPADDGRDEGSAFVRRCVERIARVDFADRDTARIYARVERGRLVWTDEAHIAARDDAGTVRAVLGALVPATGDDPPPPSGAAVATGAADTPGADISRADASTEPTPIDVEREVHFTVGRWAAKARVADRV